MGRTWGMSGEQWAEAKMRLASLLGEAGRQRSTVTYGEAARVAFEGRFTPRSRALMDLLGDVDREMDAAEGVMIASLVVRADSGIPGEGYFAFADGTLGRRALEDPHGFWLEEVRRVWEYFESTAQHAEETS